MMSRSKFQIQIKERPRISVLICALNEEGNLSRVLPKIPDFVNEVILIDGHSTDNTVEVAQSLCPSVKIVPQTGIGKGDALKCGFHRATGDIIVTLDADGATNPTEIHKFVRALMRGYDFAKGTRLKYGRPSQMKLHRWFGNKLLVTSANLLFGSSYTDICSGYNAFWKRSLKRLVLYSSGFEMEQELNTKAVKARLRVLEIPCAYGTRRSGASKVRDFRQGMKDFLTIVLARFFS